MFDMVLTLYELHSGDDTQGQGLCVPRPGFNGIERTASTLNATLHTPAPRHRKEDTLEHGADKNICAFGPRLS